MSNRFIIFLLDCDDERLEAGILLDEKRSEFSGKTFLKALLFSVLYCLAFIAGDDS